MAPTRLAPASRSVIAVVLAGAALLGACSKGGGASQPVATRAPSSSPTSTRVEGAVEAGGAQEEKVVSYVDPAGLFSAKTVAQWSKKAETDGSTTWSSAEGRTYTIAVTDLKGAAVADSVAADAPALGQLSGFANKGTKEEKVGGAPAVEVSYTWTRGSNPVTGRPDQGASTRLYVEGPGKRRLATITVTAPVSQTDAAEIWAQLLPSFAWGAKA